MKTVTNNEDYVRLRIYEGDLQVSEAAAELLRLEKAQHEATRFQMQEQIDNLLARCKKAGISTGGRLIG